MQAGTAMYNAGDFHGAEAAFRDALMDSPDTPEILNSLGAALEQAGQEGEAVSLFRRAIELSPAFLQAECNLANCLYKMKIFDEAAKIFLHILENSPDDPQANFGFAVTRYAQGYPEESVDAYDRFLKFFPDHFQALHNRCSALNESGRYQEAYCAYETLLAQYPDSETTRNNFGLLKLLLGDFSGFSDYESRFQALEGVYRRHITVPEWCGDHYQGKTLLIHAEQGIGDIIQIARFLPQVAKLGGTLVLEIPEAVAPLMKNIPGVSKIITRDEQIQHLDLQLSAMSLFRALGIKADSIPSSQSYLYAEPDLVRQWQLKLGNCLSPKIGLAWRGNPSHINDARRSCPAAIFLRVAQGVTSMQFFSLQLQPTPEEKLLLEQMNIIDLTADLDNFADTAALIHNLDLVICVDTAVAHLAGALGKQVWTVLPFVPDWRWLLDRNDSPWYSSMRLFRQYQLRDWVTILSEAADSLVKKFKHSGSLTDSNVTDPLPATQTIDDYLQNANTCHLSGAFQEALDLYNNALAQGLECGALHHNRGNTLLAMGRFDEAIEAYHHALQLMPTYSESHVTIASALLELGRAEDALASCDAALEIAPDNAEAHWNRALILLLLGQFHEGWQEHEWRWQKRGFTSPSRHNDIPLWNGTPLAGKTILLHAEQGFGDAIQFIRYAKLIAIQGANIIIECHPPLVPLFNIIADIRSVVPFDAPLPFCDCQAPLLSLPWLMGTTLDSIPADCPYLTVPTGRRSIWQDLVATHPGLKVGIAWAGSNVHRNDRLRSLPLALLEPLLGLEGITFFSLQIGDAGHQLKQSPLSAKVLDLCNNINDFGDTAALIEQLDLIITVDTAVAHLAGSLAKPVWLMLPFAPDWRWMLHREDSLWYPTMRLFRQDNDCSWQPVVENIRTVLSDKLCSSSVQSLKIYCYRPDIDYLLTKVNSYIRPLWFAELLKTEHTALTTVKSPEDADFILFPEYLDALLDQVGVKGARLFLQELPFFKDYEEKHLFFSNHDNAVPLGFTSVFFQTSVNRFNRDPHVAAIPYPPEWTNDELLHFELSRIRYLTSFNGNIASSLIRSELVLAVLQEQRLSVFADPLPGFHCHQSEEVQQARRLSYLQTLAESLTVLCPRGEGLNSIRFFESMALGRIPVLVSDSCLLPFEDDINYSECTFKISEADIPRAGTILADWIAASGEERLLGMCRRARAVWEQHFSAHGIQQHIIDKLHAHLRERSATSDKPIPDTSFADVLGTIRSHYTAGDYKVVRMMCDHLMLMESVPAEIYCLRGLASLDKGRPVEALPYLLKAAELSPTNPHYSINLARSIIVEGRSHDAEVLLKALLEMHPTTSEAWFLLGKTISDQHRLEEALFCFRRAETLAPHDYRAPLHAAPIYQAFGDYETAERFYVRTQILKPDCEAAGIGLENLRLLRIGSCTEISDDSHSYQQNDKLQIHPSTDDYTKKNEAIELHEHSDLNAARRMYDELLERYPDDHELLYLRGTLALQETQYGDALLLLKLAHKLAPEMPEYVLNLSITLQHNNQINEAELLLRELVVRQPDYSDAWINLGVILKEQNCLEEALACFSKAASTAPNDPRAPQNAGAVCQTLGRLEEAQQLFKQALTLNPDYGTARWNLAILEMLLGNYNQGLADFDARFHKTDPVPYRHADIPEWDGKQTVTALLVWDEQGFGDTIQCCRYIPLIKDRVKQVYIECMSPSLKELLMSVQGVSAVITLGEQLPAIESQIPIMSLMRICGSTPQTIPNSIPYLHARSEAVELWKTRLPATEGMRIGLVWRGNPRHINNVSRSCPAAEFLKLVPGFLDNHFYSLQIQPNQEEQALLQQYGVKDQTSELQNFSDTAALIHSLDLVITVDTAVAHLTGALGKQVWLLIPFAPDWRWGLNQDFTPWYPTMRIFRQQERDGWADVTGRVRDELSTHATIRHPSQQTVNSLLVSAEAFRADEAWDAALDCYQQLLVISNNDTEALMGAGGSLYFLNRFEESAEYYRRVLAKLPGDVKAHVNLGMSLLAAGRLEDGWPELEWRLTYVRHQLPPTPLITEEIVKTGSVSGKTILLHTEQGYGDSIQFIRYVDELSENGARVILTAQPEMVRLLRGCHGIEQVIPHGELLPKTDYQALLQSLPGVFSTSLKTVPAKVPYLFPEDSLVKTWQRKIGDSGNSLKVGLCWHGRQMGKSGYNRSMTPDILTPLFETKNVTFVNLNKDSGYDLPPNLRKYQFIDITSDITDFADTAALIANLDLVISIDTAVAHLVGALGKPVWTMLLHSADWRWLDKREDSPWYPSMRLFRQPSHGQWSSVITQLSEALTKIL